MRSRVVSSRLPARATFFRRINPYTDAVRFAAHGSPIAKDFSFFRFDRWREAIHRDPARDRASRRGWPADTRRAAAAAVAASASSFARRAARRGASHLRAAGEAARTAREGRAAAGAMAVP